MTGVSIMGIDLATLLEIVISSVGSAIGVYAGIRVDIAKLMERSSNAKKEAERANTRIDEMLRKN